MKHFLLSLFLCVALVICHAQQWAQPYQKSIEAYQNYQTVEARQFAEEALTKIKEEEPDLSENQTVILRQLSLICYELDDAAAAASYAKEEVEMLIALGENEGMNYANALQNLALIRMYRSEYGAAEPLLKESLDIILTYHGLDSYEVAVAKGNLAVVTFHLRQDADAKVLFEESINVLDNYEEVTGDYYSIIYNYGSLLAETGTYQEALPYFQLLESYYHQDSPNYEYGAMLIKVGDALDQVGRFAEAISKYKLAITNFIALGEESSQEYTIAMNNLNITLQKTGQFDEATVMITELLKQKKVEQTAYPLAYASTLTNYANLLLRKGELDAADSSLQEVLDLYVNQSLHKDLTYVKVLESQSTILLLQGSLSEALIKVELAMTLAQQSSLDSRLYKLYDQQAKILSAMAKYDQARSVAVKANAECGQRFGASAIQTAFVKNTLAGIYTQLGDYPAAEKLYLEVLPIFERTYGSGHPEYATVVTNYSSLLQLQGNFYTAEHYLKLAEEIKREAFGLENRDYLTTYENLALLYLNTARYTESGNILSEIIRIKSRILPSGDPSLAYSFSNYGAVKRLLADYTEAESYLKKARNIYDESYGKDHLFYAGVINNLALLYMNMGNIAAAKPLFGEALGIYESNIGRLNPDYATALENLATLYLQEDNYEKARELLEEALIIDEQVLGTSHPLYSKTLHNLASVYEKNEAYDMAKDLYLKALEIDRKVFGEDHPSYASTLYNLAVLEQEQENYEVAKANYEQVVNIRRNALGAGHPDFAYAQYGLASILHKTGAFDEAKPIFLSVTNKYLQFISQYFPSLSESEKGAFYAKIKPVFESYLDFVVEYYLLEKGTEADRQELVCSIYNLQLSTKALLLNATNKVRSTILSSGDQALIDLFNEWIGLKENIVKAYNMSQEALDRGNIDIATLETDANNVEKELSLRSATFAGAFDQEVPDWQQVQQLLDTGEAAMEIIRIKKKMKTDSVLYIGLLLGASHGPKMIINANGIFMEDKGFKSYKNAIVYKVDDRLSYDVFWKTFDQQVDPSISNLYLSADGVLNKVNVSTLYDPVTEQYLVDKYKIRLLSNTRELISDVKSNTLTKIAVLIGYPKYNLMGTEVPTTDFLLATNDMERSFGSEVTELPGTLKEIQDIATIVGDGGWQLETYLSTKATEQAVKAMKSPMILHIATHGFFLEDIKEIAGSVGLASRSAKFNPLLRSGLLLAGAQNTLKNEGLPGGEDGILTAYEVMNLNLDNTQLVVMSACETGLGEVKNGEGVYGLQRSFIVAGAENLLMSLWKVNDQTTQMLMSSFYKHWHGGMSKLEAFSQAISEVRSEYSDPYYWGAFVMLGK